MKYRKSKETKERILQAAVTVAARDGYHAMRRDEIALEADCAASLINTYFHTMVQLRAAVMRRAVRDRVVPVVLAGLAINDAQALKAPADLKSEVFASMGG